MAPKFPARLLSAALAFALSAALAQPALARESYVNDGAGLFSAATVSSLNEKIGDFHAQTGKEVVVVTVPSLDGATASAAAERVFAQDQVNGVLIFLSKAEKQDGIIGDEASKTFFPPGTFATIRQAMRGYFRSGDFDTGITTGVGLVIDQYRSHERALGTGTSSVQTVAPRANSQSFGGFMSMIWLFLILIAGFLIIRALFRAFTGGPRMMPPGYGPGGPGMPGPGYGGGYGYGGGGGGGSFFSGLLGGLGGAFLGNELFNRGGNIMGNPAGMIGGGDAGSQIDNAGWQPDAGQADMGNASFGGFGDSGGGFDTGGGGGFDGGGGDGGGGW